MYSTLQEQLPPTATNVIDCVDTTDEAFASVIEAADTELVHVLVADFDDDAFMEAVLNGEVIYAVAS